ncbi:hypothetical protein ACWDNR_24945, partial [Gordonia aichiensis]
MAEWDPKPASSNTAQANKDAVANYAMDDRADFDVIDRGFIAGIPDDRITTPDGEVVYDGHLLDYISVQTPCPDTVNPSLWRQSQAASLGGDGRAVGAFAVFTALGGFAMAAGAAASPTLTRLLGSVRRTVVLALVLTAVAVAALGTPMLLVVAVGYVGVYLALGAPEPLLDTLTHRAATAGERATVLSVQSLALRICGSVGALAAGVLAAHVSAAAVWVLVVAVLG